MQWREDEGKFFRRVYTSCSPIVLRVIYKITGDMETAEEICHDAFIKYYERLDTIPDERQALYWLIRVGKNLALNHEKRKGRERRAFERVYFEPKTPQDSGETVLLKEESSELLREALEKLPDSLREVIILKEYGELTYREIGEILGITEGNVKVRAYRARERLLKALGEGDVYVP
ncbi:MAG: RNA polymerase sigma factor [Alkalispirochaetaceae bacterium]